MWWKWNKYWKKVFRLSILFQPNWINLQPVTAFMNTRGVPHPVDKWQNSLLATNHKYSTVLSVLYRLHTVFYLELFHMPSIIFMNIFPLHFIYHAPTPMLNFSTNVCFYMIVNQVLRTLSSGVVIWVEPNEMPVSLTKAIWGSNIRQSASS